MKGYVVAGLVLLLGIMFFGFVAYTLVASLFPELQVQLTGRTVGTVGEQESGEQEQDSMNIVIVIDGWFVWRAGDIQGAESWAESVLEGEPGNQEALHLKVAASAVQGKYGEAVESYSGIDPEYEEFENVTRIVASIYMNHDVDMEKAVELFEGIDDPRAEIARERLEKPLEVEANGTFVIPFQAVDPITPLLPYIAGTVNGNETILSMDTGGTYLIMGPLQAEEFGIERGNESGGLQSPGRFMVWNGVVDELVLGDEVVLRNVPVVVMEGLDATIFGTNILESFLATVDYPNKRLILTSRDREDLFEAHMDMVEGEKVTMPFYLFEDNFMFGRGSFAGQDVTLFFNSGLLAIALIDGEIRQASFMASRNRLLSWGINESELDESGFIETDFALGVAGLEQNDTLVLFDSNFQEDWVVGGVVMGGLVSHAFLSEYSWTIDFERHEYVFGL